MRSCSYNPGYMLPHRTGGGFGLRYREQSIGFLDPKPSVDGELQHEILCLRGPGGWDCVQYSSGVLFNSIPTLSSRIGYYSDQVLAIGMRLGI